MDGCVVQGCYKTQQYRLRDPESRLPLADNAGFMQTPEDKYALHSMAEADVVIVGKREEGIGRLK